MLQLFKNTNLGIITKKFLAQDYLILFLFTCIAAGVNLTKAVQIDDTAYLEIARAILKHPLNPLSQLINWGNTSQPIFFINQPLFLFYLYAFLMKVFGESEFVLHLFMGVWSGLAILLFYLLLKRLQIGHLLFVTGLFALGPSFLPGQNLMVDVPLIALWLMFFLSLIATEEKEDVAKYVLAAIVASIACLTKYTSLVLLPILLIMIIYRRHWRSLWIMGIPALILLAWSTFNYFDFGAFHIIGRHLPTLTPINLFYRCITWIAGVGSVSPFVLSFFSMNRFGQANKAIVLIAMLAGGYLFIFMVKNEQTQYAIYWIVFFIFGVIIHCFMLCYLTLKMHIAFRMNDLQTLGRTVLLGLWFVSVFTFVVLYSPFLAVRHIFLIIPVLLIVLGDNFSACGSIRLREFFSLALTVILGVTLAISDFYCASIYRNYAYTIREQLPQNAHVYQVGHWGWQWYALKAGMIQYDTERTHFQTGDYLVVPTNVDNQQISSEYLPRLQVVQQIIIPAPIPTWLRTMYTDARPGGYYFFEFPSTPPWRLSTAPFEFVIYQISE